MTNTKQLKITNIFRRGASAKIPEDCDEVQEEIQQLEQKLKEKQDELFQLQRNRLRNSCKNKISPPKNKPDPFIRPQKIVLHNSVENLKRNLELISMLSGTEVQSYVANDHCCIVYHMQHDSQFIIKHGLKIDMQSGVNEISKSSLPLGFNLSAVMEGFDNVMMPDCLSAIRKALVAYYDRLEQYEALKKLLNVEATLFKVIDGSHIEVSFTAHSDMEPEDEQIHIVLMLDYRVYDIRPKTITFKEMDLPEGAVEALREQCTIFKKKPLRKAFKEAFITGIGPYKLTQQIGPRPSERPQRRRPRPHNKHYHNDDTFHPEDCSDQSDYASDN
ncbi:uncharacterized protein LOC135085089 [Ostrinia nubilalis]|uniref:uncharacterized protein LOC114351820 n=1 Tax=Ostrinia furnacalis TaxID=93504 RepID=UPI00103E4E37|nr:uncharacterized protein LOC114351820 [Ostrinia furnacalis]